MAIVPHAALPIVERVGRRVRPQHHRRHTPADALTIGNASCGTIAIFSVSTTSPPANARFLWIAFILLPLALVCDVLDGYVARLNRRGSRCSAPISIRWRT